jgi:hypothetical protein
MDRGHIQGQDGVQPQRLVRNGLLSDGMRYETVNIPMHGTSLLSDSELHLAEYGRDSTVPRFTEACRNIRKQRMSDGSSDILNYLLNKASHSTISANNI